VARCVIGDLGFGLALGLGFAQVDGGALDGNEAPTAAQAALLGGKAHGFAVGASALGFLEQAQSESPEIIGGNGDDLNAPKLERIRRDV